MTKRVAARLSRILTVSVLATVLYGCSDSGSDVELPRVLILGDSISIGYTEPVRELLIGEAHVERNPGNAEHSGHGLANLEKWLGGGDWDVIHFNHGLHDLKFVDDEGNNVTEAGVGHVQVPLDQYGRNLEAIVQRLAKTRATLIFATTTPYPEHLVVPIRLAMEVEAYNEVALKVMRRHGVAVNDLYAFALPRTAEIQKPQDCHFTPEGSRALAEEVARHIREALESRVPKNVE
jgi:acyl-CoA thioesterase-1